MDDQPISPALTDVNIQQFHSGRPAYISSSSNCQYTTVSQWTSSLYLQLQQLSIYNSVTVDVQSISPAPATVNIQQCHSGRPVYISSSSNCQYTTVSQWTSSLYLQLQQLSIYYSVTVDVQPISPALATVNIQQCHSGRPAYISSSSNCQYTTVSQWASSLYLQLQQLSIYNSVTVDVQPISQALATVNILQCHSGRPVYISSSSNCQYTTVSQWTSNLYLQL